MNGEKVICRRVSEGVYLNIPQTFNLDQIAESGQCFRMTPIQDGGYVVVNGVHVVKIIPHKSCGYVFHCSFDEFRDIWIPYFDLRVDYAKYQKKMAEAELDNDQQNVRFMLVGHYLDLFQLHNQKRVYEKNIEQTRLLIKEIESAFEQGTALKSDITRYELQLKNLELGRTNVSNRIRILNRQLVTTIGLETNTEIFPDTTLLSMNLDKKNELHWQNERNNAPVMQLADLGIQMSERQQNLIRAGRRPTIGLMASNNFDGPILIEVPPINKNFNYWFVGVNVTYKFDSLFKNNKKLKQAKLATLKAQESKRLADEQLSNGINAAYIQLEEAYTRLDTKEKSVQLAHENYEVVHSRYLNGLSLVTDMLDASNIQLSSELELANAQIGILYQYFMLKKTVGTL